MNQHKKLIYWLLVFVAVLFLLIACFRIFGHSSTKGEAAPVDSMKILIHHVQNCSRLYTAEVVVRKVVTHDDEVNIHANVLSKKIDFGLPLGKRKVAIPMEATMKAYVDLSGFSDKNVSKDGDKIEIILPDPKVVLTHTKVKNKEIKKNIPFLRSDFSDEEMTKYEEQGRNDIIAAIPQLNIIPTAQEGAAKVLIPFLEQLGYKEENITITFRKEFTFDEIKRLIVND